MPKPFTAESLVAQWRSSAIDNPAGPLFSSQYTEFEFTNEARYVDTVQHGCSTCTASRGHFCC